MPDQRIGVDTGGTFTDLAVLDRGRLRVHKLPSTPDDPARAVLDGLDTVRSVDSTGRPRPVDVVHGTTVGLNALLMGRGARVAWITNDGFVDLVEIGRGNRRGLYDLEPERGTFPVPRSLRFTLATRRDVDGRALTRIDPAELEALVERVRRARVDAVAVGFLHSPRAPADELRVARALRKLGLPITTSAALLPRSGEFERFTAACLNAAIQPIVSDYLARLERGVAPGRVRLLRNTGGTLPAEEARSFPLRAVLSGPAGGVVAASAVARRIGTERLAAFDMGGTSTDVCLVTQTPDPPETPGELAGLPLAVPTLAVHTIGCGGGSIAYADAGGALRVGPESAGADPGPACYGRGDQPTVTDAHVALGHIGGDTLLGGAYPIDPDRAVRAIEALGRSLGMATVRCAEGILQVAEAAMQRALQVITSSASVDPSTVPLLAYGGAGGLHAARLARALEMPGAVVAPAAGIFSAIGLALAAPSIEEWCDLHVALDLAGRRLLNERADQLRETALERLTEARGRCRIDVRLRYRGQGTGLWTPLRGANLEARFRRLHEERFGFDEPSAEVEAVELRARAEGRGRTWPKQFEEPEPPMGAGKRTAPLGGKRWTIYRREDIAKSMRAVRGPVLIEEATSVTVVPEDFEIRWDDDLLWVRPAK